MFYVFLYVEISSKDFSASNLKRSSAITPPSPRCRGDIIYVDYERSSWKYMDDEKTFSENDVNSYKIGGNSHVVCDTMEPYLLGGAAKGGGSAYVGGTSP